MNSIPAKDVIYIDVDDEITTIIEKVRNSQSKIVALVLPKRAATLQSIVNMKLLKKSADDGKKHLVLITAEAGLLPLAAATELYVAKNLQSKPEIPVAPSSPDLLADIDEDSVLLDEEPKLDASKSVGDLAGRSSSAAGRTFSPSHSVKPGAVAKGDDTIDMADIPDVSASAAQAGGDVKAVKPKKDKSRKVPNFNKFRLWLIIGAGALAAIILLFILAFKVLPSATVLVKTDSQAVDANVSLTLLSSSSALDASAAKVPSQTQKVEKTLTQQQSASGQKNNGEKASGTINMSAGACTGSQPADVAAGTGVTSSGLTFITQTTATFDSKTVAGKCTWQSTKTIAVSAQNGGANYNIGASTFTVAGRSDVSASSSNAMTGGTDDIQKILQQSDIDSAKSKLESQDMSVIKTQLQNQLSSAGYMPIAATFTAGSPKITTSANVGDPVENVTVTEVIEYTMAGAKQTDLQKVIASAIKDKIDTSKQSILDYGLGDASYGTPTVSGSNTVIGLQSTVVVGPDLKTDSLVKQIAGKKSGDATSIIKANPGVTDVTIHYSPFWVSSMPHNESKITITIDKPQTTKK